MFEGFNLILFDGESMGHVANGTRSFDDNLEPGVYSVSNLHFDSDWPKQTKGKQLLMEYLETLKEEESVELDPLFDILNNTDPVAEEDAPELPYGHDWSMKTATVFVPKFELDTQQDTEGEPFHYGTRAQTVIVIDEDDHVCYTEHSFDVKKDKWIVNSFEFQVGDVDSLEKLELESGRFDRKE
eukprot:TRINITY_DN5142_c0_g1_i3.p2 TRINITY_DN5142_c0_g1~~TRINITY_DN5142_c0_g1_i3.p2  ORF type:complete len:184 (-),score=60.18 TRINITY_DN5142_c0_g1_i3:475-1026(-)